MCHQVFKKKFSVPRSQHARFSNPCSINCDATQQTFTTDQYLVRVTTGFSNFNFLLSIEYSARQKCILSFGGDCRDTLETPEIDPFLLVLVWYNVERHVYSRGFDHITKFLHRRVLVPLNQILYLPAPSTISLVYW